MSQLLKRTLLITFLAVIPSFVLESIKDYINQPIQHLEPTILLLASLLIALILMAVYIAVSLNKKSKTTTK